MGGERPRDRWLDPWGLGLALLALGLATWWGVIHDGIVSYDTPWLVRDNPLLNQGDPASILPILWDLSRGTRLVLGAEYLPVRDLTVLLDFALFGPRWALHHAQNLTWYLAACLVFWRIAARLVPDRATAWLAGALFLLHPVHVESVAWLASRKDVVSLFFFLAAVWAYLAGHGRPWRTGAVLGCAALATWSKSTAIVLPGLLVAHSLVIFRERPFRLGWWAAWLPLGLLTAAALAIAIRVGGHVSMYAPLRGGSHAAALLLETRVILHYFAMLAWPVHLSVLYPEPPPLPLGHPASLAGLAVVGSLLAAIPLTARRAPLVSLGLCWFFLTLLPVAQILPIQNLMADRYLILPWGGLVLALAAGLAALRRRLGMAPLLAVGVACLGLAWATWTRIPAWHDSVALWSAALEVYPDSEKARRFLAGALAEAGRPEEAEAVLTAGLIRPGTHPGLQAGLGVLRLTQRRPEEAEVLLQAAWDGDDDLREAGANLLSLLVGQGRLDEAVALGADLTRLHPLYPLGWNNYGSALLGAGRYDDAVQAFHRALDLDPFYGSAACNLALIELQRSGPEAVRPFIATCRTHGTPGAIAAFERAAATSHPREPSGDRPAGSR